MWASRQTDGVVRKPPPRHYSSLNVGKLAPGDVTLRATRFWRESRLTVGANKANQEIGVPIGIANLLIGAGGTDKAYR
jgi:hypothetical protein